MVSKMWGCQSVVSNCKELKTGYCFGIGNIGIQNVATGCLQLRNIDLSNTMVSDKGVAFLALLRNLECLSLERCSNVTDDSLKLLKSGFTTLQICLLQKLDVSGCTYFSSHGLVHLTERSVQLQELNLSESWLVIKLDGCYLDEAILSLIGRGCRRLKELSLKSCKGVTDVGVVGIVTTNSNLQKLDLTCCSDITDVALEAIATNCKGLLSLKMESCLSVTAEGWS